MKKILHLLIIWGMGYLFLGGVHGYAQNDIFVKTPTETADSAAADNDYVPDEIIVKFKSGINQSLIDRLNTKFKVNHLYKSPHAGFSLLGIPKGKKVSQMITLYKQYPSVEYAEPNYMAYAFFVPNDQYFSYQWNMYHSTSGNIAMTKAWDIATENPSIIVAVVDTGVAYENYTERVRGLTKRYYKAPDLGGTNFVGGYDFINKDSHPNDDEGHGTHVTGTICANDQ